MNRMFGRRRIVAAVVSLLSLASLAVVVNGPAGAAPATTTGPNGPTETYLIVYSSGASSARAASAVSSAGGTMVADYRQIGVVVARSADPAFADAIAAVRGVEGVSATAPFATQAEAVEADDTVTTTAAPSASEPLAGLQWNMRQINASLAHEITTGSRDVVVGDIDTGLDFTHPDLAPNYDAARSADCSSGAPQPLLAGNDRNGHGTHTAGIVAAAVNGIGLSGVAPGVSIAGIKSSTDEGFFFPEMVVCSFMWAAQAGVDVTNNSYFADPWLFNCRNDAEQRAIWTAERRAIRYAMAQGVVVVASEGNESTDLSHPEVDVISPDFPPGNEQEREIRNACAVVPVEVPGVVGVTATGDLSLKSFYSSYGISTADVAAPGGDSILQVTPEAVNGRVLSTYPPNQPCLRPVVDQGATYCYLQGTSMAGPHVAGVAALIRSQHPDLPAGTVASRLQQATNALPCPDPSIYADFPQNSGEPQSCQGGTAHNSFYGSGEIDALAAVTR